MLLYFRKVYSSDFSFHWLHIYVSQNCCHRESDFDVEVFREMLPVKMYGDAFKL